MVICINRTSKSAVEDQKKTETTLSTEVDAARSRIVEIQNELESVVEQLGEAKVDKHESARAAKKAELIDNLKRLFPGVVRFIIHEILNCALFLLLVTNKKVEFNM